MKEGIEGSTLVLTKLTRADGGAYLCIAQNGVPSPVSKRIMVHVHCKRIDSFEPKLQLLISSSIIIIIIIIFISSSESACVTEPREHHPGDWGHAGVQGKEVNILQKVRHKSSLSRK